MSSYQGAFLAQFNLYIIKLSPCVLQDTCCNTLRIKKIYSYYNIIIIVSNINLIEIIFHKIFFNNIYIYLFFSIHSFKQCKFYLKYFSQKLD